MSPQITAAPEVFPTLGESEPPGALSDERLVKRFVHDSSERAEAAFAVLIERHNSLVQRVCLALLDDRDLVQDAAQVVFLVLARKARSIRKPGSLGPWLHGVALRVARRMRRETIRRQAAERRKAEILQGRQITTARREAMDYADLHEEIDRLPEKYRRPIILCYMQGQTQERAAEILDWPLGTVQIRLHRGRERLRSRLVQRDPDRKEPTRSALLTLLAVPLIESTRGWSATTSHAAVQFAAGRATGGLVSPAVEALAESTLATMLRTPLLIVAGTTLAVALGTAAICSKATATDHRPSGSTSTKSQITSTAPQPQSRQRPEAIFARNEQVTKQVLVEAQKFTPPADQYVSPPERSEVKSDLSGPLHAPEPVSSLAMLADKAKKKSDLKSGRELFERVWVPNDPRSRDGDGLGPVFNGQACAACHSLGGIGGSGELDRNIEIASIAGDSNPGMGFSYAFSMDFGNGRMEYRMGGGYPDGSALRNSPQIARGLAAIHPGFRDGSSVLLHRYGVDPAYAVWRQAVLGEHGLVQIRVTERNPPALFGSGFIDAIPDAAIEAAARRKVSAQASFKGRVSRLNNGRIGRFGWKAQTATLGEFVLAAASGEMGLEVPGRHQATDPRLPGLGGQGLDMDQSDCDALVSFVRSLPAPISLKPADQAQWSQIKAGEEVFRSIGCAGCHLPKLGDVNGIYSDLLLHDMGMALADANAYTVFSDGRAEDQPDARGFAAKAPEGPGGGLISATLREWRTPPLWGLRHSAPYLHDGRAATVDQAVIMHGGQGAAAAKRYADLSVRRKQHLEAFLMSLSAPSVE